MRDIDMREEFDQLIKEYGRSVLYRRGSKYVPCKCYNTLHRSGDSKCPICHGAGKMVDFEKTQIIDQSNNNIGIEDTNIGRLDQKERVVWFRYDFEPRVGDLYYQVGWRNGIPMSLKAVYEIQSVDEVTGDRGRIEHYSTIIKARPDLVPNTKEILKKILGREIEVI